MPSLKVSRCGKSLRVQAHAEKAHAEHACAGKIPRGSNKELMHCGSS